LINPFGDLLLKTPRTSQPGSPELTPHKSEEKLCRIQQILVEETWLYKFSALRSKDGEQRPRAGHKLYYLAGGEFRAVTNKEHWELCAKLCTKLPEYEINLVSFPLAPQSQAPTAIPHLQRLYRTLAKQCQQQGSWITLMRDSAGGNNALVLGDYAASIFLKDQTANTESRNCPAQNIFVMSRH